MRRANDRIVEQPPEIHQREHKRRHYWELLRGTKHSIHGNYRRCLVCLPDRSSPGWHKVPGWTTKKDPTSDDELTLKYSEMPKDCFQKVCSLPEQATLPETKNKRDEPVSPRGTIQTLVSFLVRPTEKRRTTSPFQAAEKPIYRVIILWGENRQL